MPDTYTSSSHAEVPTWQLKRMREGQERGDMRTDKRMNQKTVRKRARTRMVRSGDKAEARG